MCPPIRTACHSHLVSFSSNPPVEPCIALQVPSMATVPQYSGDPPASSTAAGASREGASAGLIHLEGDSPSWNLPGADPNDGGSSGDDGSGRRKKFKPSQKEWKTHCSKGRKDGYPPDRYSSPSSPSSSASGSDSESESLTAPTPTFGPKQKKISVRKPTNHRSQVFHDMVAWSESSREIRPGEVSPPVAAWISRSCRDNLREAERLTLATVAKNSQHHGRCCERISTAKWSTPSPFKRTSTPHAIAIVSPPPRAFYLKHDRRTCMPCSLRS